MERMKIECINKTVFFDKIRLSLSKKIYYRCNNCGASVKKISNNEYAVIKPHKDNCLRTNETNKTYYKSNRLFWQGLEQSYDKDEIVNCEDANLIQNKVIILESKKSLFAKITIPKN